MHRVLKKTFLAIIFFGLFVSNLFSFTDEIKDAINAIHRGNATKWQQALAFDNNRIINQMAYIGAIDKNVYLSNQKWFAEMNLKFAKDAAKRMGMTVTVQVNPSGIVKPGVDSDYHLWKSSRDISLNEMKTVRRFYGERVEEFFKESNYNFKPGTEWGYKTNTDLMSPADQTKESLQIADWTNYDMRGAAYRSPEAAVVEGMIRDGKKYFSPQYAAAYNQEMNYQVNRMSRVIAEFDNSIAKLSTIKNPTIAQQNALFSLQISQKMNDALVAKYIVRKYEIAKIMADRFNIKMQYTPPDIVFKAATRTYQTAELAKFVRVNSNYYIQSLDNEFKRIMDLGPQGRLAKIDFKLAEFRFDLEQRAANAWQRIDTSAPYRYVADKFNSAYQNMWDRAAGWGERIQKLPSYQNMANFASRWGKPIANVLNNVDNGTWRRFTNSRIGFQDVKPESLSGRMSKWAQEKGFKYGGWILTFLVYYDIAKEAYATGEYAQGAINALIATGVMWGIGKLLGWALAPLIAANPISATVLATLALSYLLTREFMSRVEIGGKTLDEHTQDYIDDQFFQSSQYDVGAEGDLMRLYINALKKGHKLKDGMTVAQGWKKVLENIKKGGKYFGNIFDENKIPGTNPGGGYYGKTTVINSTIKNEVSGTAVAKEGSEINTGVNAKGSYIKDSHIENKGNVNVEAGEKSKVNTGVNLDKANVQSSQIYVETQGKITAKDGSNVNAGLDANSSRIRESEIRSTSKVNITAQDKSSINTGVKANNVDIKNSKLVNSASGTANAAKGSTINMGMKFEKSDDEPDMSHFK